MSKTTYTLSNPTANDIGIGSLGFLPANSQAPFTVEEDSADEVFINQLIAQGKATKVSAVSTPQSFGAANLSSTQIEDFNLGNWRTAAGGLVALQRGATPSVQRTTGGLLITGRCELAGWDTIVPGSSVSLVIYDSLTASGKIVVPSTVLVLGRTEFGFKRLLDIGCHITLSGAATVNILVG